MTLVQLTMLMTNTARRLQAALNGISPQARRYLIDVLRDTIRRSAPDHPDDEITERNH
jgi:hypothetical protein